MNPNMDIVDHLVKITSPSDLHLLISTIGDRMGRTKGTSGQIGPGNKSLSGRAGKQ